VSKGFLVFAQNTDQVDYIQQAYALALSIKHSQHTTKSISIVTNDNIPKRYRPVFDHIIPVPWSKDDVTEFCAEHRWQLYYATPYDETIVLDTDMLFLDDISGWWEYCSNYDLKFCSRVLNYKVEPIHDTVYRKAFIANNLTNPYFALHYFKKSRIAYEFYKVLEFVVNNWNWCYDNFAFKEYQEWLSMDLASAIAIEISGLQDMVVDVCSPLEFVHMKPLIQGWPVFVSNWQSAVHYVYSDTGDLFVGNIRQPKLFHYVDKGFLNGNIIKTLENLNHD